MHRCLSISEVLSLIFTQLYKANLSSLARTCRAFQQPALDLLWQNQNGLIPLLKCMPDDVWEERGDGKRKTLHFRRPVTTQDWNRFISYARRVKTFAMRSILSGGRVDIRVYHAISLSYPLPLIFPNLQALIWAPDDEIFQYARMFLAPGLIRLHLSLEPQSMAKLSLLPSLKQLCPSITNLTLISWQQGGTLAFSTISDNICQWNRLEVLDAPYMSHHAIRHISTLADLRQLTLQLPDNFNEGLQAIQCLPFPSLQYLSVSSCNTSIISTFIACMRPHMVTLVSLSVDGPVLSDWKHLVHTIQQRMSHSSVIEVHLVEECETGRTDVIPGDVLCPLFSFANLTILEFAPTYPFALDNATIRDMANAFHWIQKLELGTSVGSSGHTKVTLSGLVPLVQMCPDLRFLGIVVCTSDTRHRSSCKPGRGFSNLNISSLSLGDSRIEEPAAVASFLSDIFPELTSIHTMYLFDNTITDADVELYEKRWNEAAELVPLFTAVRRQERSWYEESNGSESSMADSDSE